MQESLIKILLEFGLGATVCIICLIMFYKIFISMREDSKEREIADRDIISRLSNIVATNSKALLENSEVMKEISEQIRSIDDKLTDVQEDVQEIKLRQKIKDEDNRKK